MITERDGAEVRLTAVLYNNVTQVLLGWLLVSDNLRLCRNQLGTGFANFVCLQIIKRQSLSHS